MSTAFPSAGQKARTLERGTPGGSLIDASMLAFDIKNHAATPMMIQAAPMTNPYQTSF
jgi:hypothetical protein